MIKYLVIIFLFISSICYGQTEPSGFPTQFNTGWQQWGYQQSTKGTIIATRDTLWIPRYCGTMVLWPHAGVDTAYWMWDCIKWKKISTASDIVAPVWGNITGTLSNQTDLQNALNLKLNIADTANKWVQNVYARNDSLFKFKNGAETFIDLMTIYANNGLSKSGDTVQIGAPNTSGSPLLSNRWINTATFKLTVQGATSTSGNVFEGINTGSGTGVYGSSINEYGVLGNSDNLYAVYGVSGTSNAIRGWTTNGNTAAYFEQTASSTNTVTPTLQIKRTTSGTAAAGIGSSIEWYIEKDNGANNTQSHTLRSILTTATSGAEVGQFELYGVNNATLARKFAITGAGQWVWDGYPALTAQVDSTTYKPVAIDASGNVVKMAGWTGGGGGVALNNIGAGFRWLATPGGNFKSVSNGYGIKWDSTSTANTLTAKVDTIELASKWGLEDLVWKRKGVVLSPSASAPDLNNFQEPSVIREGNPIILTSETTVFKMWWTRGWNTVGICYAESVDGRNWTQYSGNPIIANYARSSIIKDGSTYVIYAVPGVTGPRVDRFTSTDGVTFSLINTGVITQGTAGQWNDGGVFNSWVIKDGSTYRMLVDGLSNTTQSYADGYYTSSDGITWTPYASNPVTYITGAYFTKIGSEFWLWGHAAPPGTVLLPTDAYRAHSSDMINWTYDPIPYNSTFHRYTDDEGADSSRGQVADLNLLTVGDSVYMFYSATRDGDQQSGKLQIKLAVAEMPFANLIATRENADRFRTFETSNRDIYYPFGNVGFGASKVRPTFPVDVETNIRSDAGFVSWNQSVGTADAALIGYNLYHRAVSPIWRLIDTTNHGMGIQYGSNDIRVMTTITVNTSSPTITVLGTFRRTDTTFSWVGRTLLGNGATDDGVSVLNVNGPIKFNGNLTELGTINGLRVWKGANAGGDNAAVGNGLAASTTSDRNAVIGMQSLFSITTGSFNSALGAYTLQNLTSGNFNTGAGDVTLGSLLTGSSNSAFGRASFNPLQDGDGNSGLGTNSGRSVVHGSNNTAIGLAAMYTDGTTASTDVTGSVALGYNAQVTQNNSGVLGGLDANGFGMRWGIGKTAPLAWLHLPRGKTTAGFAPLKIDSGALLTTPEAYAIEVDGDSIYWTNRALDRIALNRTGSGSVTTLYTGDGTLAGNRTITASNNNLTFSDLNTLKTSFDLFVQARADGGVPYSTLIDAGGFGRWQLGYTPTAGVYSKGSAIMIDTNNNVGLGTFLPSSAPLYATGNSAYANGFQSQSGNFYRVDNVTSDQTIGLTQNYFNIDATSGNITITLPAASTAFGGVIGIDYIFKRIDNSGNSVTIQRAGSDTIDGATSFTLTTQWESKNLRATSTSTWNIY